jgi:hypothetical protein
MASHGLSGTGSAQLGCRADVALRSKYCGFGPHPVGGKDHRNRPDLNAPAQGAAALFAVAGHRQSLGQLGQQPGFEVTIETVGGYQRLAQVTGGASGTAGKESDPGQ